MRKFRLTRDMVQAAPGGSTVVYTEEQVKAIRECALTRENQGRLLEYVAAGGHLSLVWLHSTISPESPNYSSAPRRSLYTLHLCATPKNVEPGKEYSLLSMVGVDAVEVLDTLFFEAPETYNLRNPAKPVPGATHLNPFVGVEEEMLNRHQLTRHDITLTLPPDSNKVIKPTDLHELTGAYPVECGRKYFLYPRTVAEDLRALAAYRGTVSLKNFLAEYLRRGGKVVLTGRRTGETQGTLYLSFTDFNAVEGLSPLFDASNPKHLDVFDTLIFDLPDSQVEADPVKRRLYEPHGLTPEDILDML